jgi:hypothetical protein
LPPVKAPGFGDRRKASFHRVEERLVLPTSVCRSLFDDVPA